MSPLRMRTPPPGPAPPSCAQAGGGSIKFRWKAAGRVPAPERINCRDTPAVHQWADPRNAHRVPAPARPPSAEAHERHLLARVQRRVLHALDGAVRVAGSVACMGLPLRYRLQAAEVEHLEADPCRRRFLLPRARHSAPRCDDLQTVAVMSAHNPGAREGWACLACACVSRTPRVGKLVEQAATPALGPWYSKDGPKF